MKLKELSEEDIRKALDKMFGGLWVDYFFDGASSLLVVMDEGDDRRVEDYQLFEALGE